MQLKKIGWRRFGIVVSFIWVLGWACFIFWPSKNGRSDDDYLEACNRELSHRTEELQHLETKIDRDKMQARNSAVYQKCQREADAAIKRERKMNIIGTRQAILLSCLTVLFGWLFVWGLIGLARCRFAISKLVRRR